MKLFSRFQGGSKKPDTLTYELPPELRTQIVQIWEKGFGPDDRYNPGPAMAYERIHQILCEEHQMFQLPQVSPRQLPLRGIIAKYLLNLEDTAKVLDVVQVVFSTMEEMLHIRVHPCPFRLRQLRRDKPWLKCFRVFGMFRG